MASWIAVTMIAQIACGATPTPVELQEARKWIVAKFEGIVDTAAAEAGIEVLANNDPVQLNARGGKPMHILDQQFTRGLYCHAVSKLIVRLPQPGARLTAIVGVDSNDQTSGGRGSVIFSVRVGDRELWKSDVMREGMAGVPVSVDLGGATEFFLLVDDAGDGIGCDQSDWADAQVTLADGSALWLGDLPLVVHQRVPYDAAPFFSFTYGGVLSSEFLASWDVTRASERLDDVRTQHTITYTDKDTGLVVRCVGVEYQDFPNIEWTLYFKNTGSADTPILSDICAIDTPFHRAGETEFVLYRNKGDDCSKDSFEPLTDPLPAGVEKRITNARGRPTQIEWPYFNIASGNEGLIFVVSWGGQWAADFIRDAGYGLRLRAGQELTHFTLHPGEEVRTPMIVLQFWKGDRLHAQNVWRAWMIAHNLPRPGGQLPPVPELAACSSHQFGEMIHADRDSQIFFVDKYLERGLKLDYWWMDAGWYWCDGQWPKTGTWEVDTDRFPGGLRAITDHAHAKDVKSIVWFEPERVHPGTWLTENHPEWVFGGANGGLLKLGEPEVREWLTNHVDKLITEQGIDLYRQDYNIDPLGFWRGNDVEDRQGITEIRHVEGYYAYWDELRRRHPNMLIDSCASGGRRNDLETLRRAVPLLRSDYIMEPVGNQCHTYALASWFPFYGTGSSKTDSYMIRSTLCPHYTACWDQRDDSIDWATIKTLVDQWKAFAPNYYGDYYPLTAYSLADDAWIGWQFDRPEAGEGMVQVFRRDASVYTAAQLPLHALDADVRYRVTDLDRPDSPVEVSGKDLLERGLEVTIADRPGSAFFVYKKL
ncbi:MAG TPA: NPCBM/NEW2 domain-containing protein [Candidatus Hydrogenedentes bacterium]|nr:NPCBM/NEW2 domain-containing protein [Candidatus Hydrogenedentota bacterium]HPG69287.1 NPCBM/NEW2 domain-containing protein [Candidatus Hydrogenedentota bacterium]